MNQSQSITVTGSLADDAFFERVRQMPTVEDVIDGLVEGAANALEAGNVYVGTFEEDIIREAVRKAIEYRVAAS